MKKVLWPQRFGKDGCNYFNNVFFVICARSIISQYLREAEIITLCITAKINMWHYFVHTYIL
jgi:hypothetical protein